LRKNVEKIHKKFVEKEKVVTFAARFEMKRSSLTILKD